MIVDEVCHNIKENIFEANVLNDVLKPLKSIKADINSLSVSELTEKVKNILYAREEQLRKLENSGAISSKVKKHNKEVIKIFAGINDKINKNTYDSASLMFNDIKSYYDQRTALYKTKTNNVKERLHNAFSFVEKAFGDGNEMLILMTELTVIDECAIFISKYGSEDYSIHNKEMMLSNKSDDILKKINEIEGI